MRKWKTFYSLKNISSSYAHNLKSQTTPSTFFEYDLSPVFISIVGHFARNRKGQQRTKCWILYSEWKNKNVHDKYLPTGFSSHYFNQLNLVVCSVAQMERQRWFWGWWNIFTEFQNFIFFFSFQYFFLAHFKSKMKTWVGSGGWEKLGWLIMWLLPFQRCNAKLDLKVIWRWTLQVSIAAVLNWLPF